jgi:hypothetical protein
MISLGEMGGLKGYRRTNARRVQGKGEVKTFGLTGKAGRPRYITDPIVHAEDVDVEERATYTPIEGQDNNRNESTLSRMSITRFCIRFD